MVAYLEDFAVCLHLVMISMIMSNAEDTSPIPPAST